MFKHVHVHVHGHVQVHVHMHKIPFCLVDNGTSKPRVQPSPVIPPPFTKQDEMRLLVVGAIRLTEGLSPLYIYRHEGLH